MTNGTERIYKESTVSPMSTEQLVKVMIEVMKEVNGLGFERRNYVAQMLLMEKKCYDFCKAEGLLNSP
jgi:hypothetical protein